ncbi:MAG: hypothetical protein R3293_27500, partial [Candidatus Promineifilaceae bacterium]|nr:hypothetical protein [Candidatus Promineifilaceae bacterium]
LAAIGLYAGWRLFWFMTDDAYIAFRYISNSVLGYGYTWNTPPFRPVEGYTSFLWVVLLDIIWRVTGIEPPDSANVISLLFAFATILLGIAILVKLPLSERLQKIRLPIIILILIGLLTNRTFLAWTSSGLETAMFNFFVTAWVYACLIIRPYTPRWVLAITVTAVLTTFTRPDGLLFVAATIFLIAMAVLANFNNRHALRRILAAALPLSAVVIHVLWRKQKYGEWVPNTFAAKYVAPWPASGWRYLLSFIIEYSLWFWIALALIFVLYRLSKVKALSRESIAEQLIHNWRPTYRIVSLVTLATLLLHTLYYTFMIGGDHFEYRVYSHLILLILLSSIWMLNNLDVSARGVIVFLALFVILSWPLQWTHWFATQDITTREATFKLHVPIADYFPSIIQPYVQIFDDVQFWLIDHNVASRHQEHKIFLEYQMSEYPDRDFGELLTQNKFPVLVTGTVGVPGWMLPTTNIIDGLGLNDYVVARNQVPDLGYRQMAHDRLLPVGYAECFEPNVRVIMGRKIVLFDRELTADEIVNCEKKTWPVSISENDDVTTLGIDHINTPILDDYIWREWPPGNLYFYYDPFQATSKASTQELFSKFAQYEGLGCTIALPADQLVTTDDFLFAFFAAQDRPVLSELALDFPWMEHLRENAPAEVIMPYDIAYGTAPGEGTLSQFNQEALAVWTNDIELIEYELLEQYLAPGDTLHLNLTYRVNSALESDENAFVHLIGEAFNPATEGPLWGQLDADPCQEFYPMEQWPIGAVVLSKATIQLPPDIPPGEYQLRTGFYEWQSGERITLISGEEEEDSWIVPTAITVTPAISRS